MTRILLLFLVAACMPAELTAQMHDHTQPALFEGLGDHHFEITTANPQAQAYFDQGLILSYAFNHDEAERSFREAARLDPSCAMCHWGIAWVLGPNINAPMTPEAGPKAWEALEKAVALSARATPRERAYIQALSARYVADPPPDRSDLDRAFANAMGEVAREYPDDVDALTIYAEALMDLSPWNYWADDGSPREMTPVILETLETALEKDSTNPGANHFYIHVVEKERPELGVAAADRLAGLVPAAGHLVHMPGHIYIRVGRYHDAVLANEAAILADAEYGLQHKHGHGLYTLAYMPHNPHFLWVAAALAGSSTRAVDAAWDVMAMTDTTIMRQPGLEMLQHFYVTPIYALTRFGRWDEILELPEPTEDLIYPRAVHHYARAIAFARKGLLEDARTEHASFEEVAGSPALEPIMVAGLNPVTMLLEIADHVIQAEIRVAEGQLDAAIPHYRSAIETQDQLVYDEPPAWYFPVRQALGSTLMKAGRPVEAEAVYLEDLEEFPENGWSLYGLQRSLEAQGRDDEAASVQQRFHSAWTHADFELTDSYL